MAIKYRVGGFFKSKSSANKKANEFKEKGYKLSVVKTKCKKSGKAGKTWKITGRTTKG